MAESQGIEVQSIGALYAAGSLRVRGAVMMVEFIGSTGSGKTTVVGVVQRHLADRAHAQTAPDFVCSLLHLPAPKRPPLRNLVSDLVGLPFCLGSLRRHLPFLQFSLGVLARERLTWQALNRVRSTVRKVGVYEIIRRHGGGRIVLVDEGTILNAHNLFVYASCPYAGADLRRFTSVVPLPDLIVHVRAPLHDLVRRTLQRPDPPREIRSRDPGLAELYVRRASSMFEALAQLPGLRGRVIAIDNPGCRAGAGAPAIKDVVESILARASQGRATE